MVEHGEWRRIQFIKNFKGNCCCKPFRKYNIVKGWFNKEGGYWVHYTKMGIHFIPEEFVKIYKKGGLDHGQKVY